MPNGGTSEKDYRKILETLARSEGSLLSVFSDFVAMVACSMANQSREKEYCEIASKYTKDQLEMISKAMAALVTEMPAAH